MFATDTSYISQLVNNDYKAASADASISVQKKQFSRQRLTLWQFP